MRRLAIGLRLMALASTGCGGSEDALGAAPTPTEEPPRVAGMQALFVGPLEGDPDRGCLWLTTTGPVSIDWPEGLIGAREPLRLVGPTGEVVARPGDILSLGGVSGHRVDCKVRDHVFIAHEIERVTPGPQSTASTP